jgi:hypothetical protein
MPSDPVGGDGTNTPNQRADERVNLQLAIRVEGYDPDGKKWDEMTVGDDISSGGAAFPLDHEVAKGQALLLSLRLPKRFRTFDHAAESYRVWAIVRKVEKTAKGFQLGMMFAGKNPPRGFHENPAIRYLLPGETRPAATLAKPGPKEPEERRVEPRFTVFLNLQLQGRAPDGEVISEPTVAENLSKSGARVMTTLPLAKGDIIVVTELGGDFLTRAEVRSITIGKDNIPRLSLKFLDQKVPDRLIAK